MRTQTHKKDDTQNFNETKSTSKEKRHALRASRHLVSSISGVVVAVEELEHPLVVLLPLVTLCGQRLHRVVDILLVHLKSN